MTDVPAPQMKSSTNRRRPFSLREMFCLMTFSGVFLALLLGAQWSESERLLLLFTLALPWLGIVLARLGKWRGWPVGILFGVTGALCAVGLIRQSLLNEFDELATQFGNPAPELIELRNAHRLIIAVTLVLAILLALLAVACYEFLAWAIDGSERGLVATARRCPRRTAVVAPVAAALVLSIMNIDFLLAPRAWAPRHFIPLTHLERPTYSNHGLSIVRTGELSAHGDWLLVESYQPGIGREATEKEMYRLDPRPHVVPIFEKPRQATNVAFNSATNRIVFREWTGDFFNDRPAATHHLRILDLDRRTSEILTEKPRESDLHSLQWLAGGGIVIQYGDNWNGRRGYTKLEPGAAGKWTRHDSAVNTAFDPRSGTALEFSDGGARLVDLVTSRELEAFSQQWVDEMTELMGDQDADSFHISPDARFLLAGPKIYDRETKQTQNWRAKDGYSHSYFHSFTNRGHAVLVANTSYPTWYSIRVLADVPFGRRLFEWLTRAPIRWIDPATGSEVARTRGLKVSPGPIRIAHDGSRMAVFTDDGIYVYDIPAKFRSADAFRSTDARE